MNQERIGSGFASVVDMAFLRSAPLRGCSNVRTTAGVMQGESHKKSRLPFGHRKLLDPRGRVHSEEGNSTARFTELAGCLNSLSQDAQKWHGGCGIRTQMRVTITIALLATACVTIIFLYGGRLLTDRHRVGTYTYSLPAGSSQVAASNAILDGLNFALREGHLDPNEWRPIDSTSIPPTLSASPSEHEIRLALSNSVTRKIIYAHMDIRSRDQLRIRLYRSK